MMNSNAINELSLRHSFFEIEAMSLQVKSFIKEGLIASLNNGNFLYSGDVYDYASLLVFFFNNNTEFMKISAKWEEVLSSPKKVLSYSECC